MGLHVRKINNSIFDSDVDEILKRQIDLLEKDQSESFTNKFKKMISFKTSSSQKLEDLKNIRNSDNIYKKIETAISLDIDYKAKVLHIIDSWVNEQAKSEGFLPPSIIYKFVIDDFDINIDNQFFNVAGSLQVENDKQHLEIYELLDENL